MLYEYNLKYIQMAMKMSIKNKKQMTRHHSGDIIINWKEMKI